MLRIPKVYKPSSVRVVTSTSEGFVGIGFDVEGEDTVRVRLSVEDAVGLGHLIRSHSDGSSGMPRRDVSSSSPVVE
ncbi:hypothetical protein Poly59_61500 [Rubripirellula reticaptiva]|uniref:Uncharacterized protein n=1 Tax=Rubripirellula reticaptiva TaxID=2528013 RepID=A0A5C6E6K8_9BACT|nr:hypothetical protein Poly59_61500 [Rubripirellula reticaptiva]